jgi:preprotein translocase subunit SecA
MFKEIIGRLTQGKLYDYKKRVEKINALEKSLKSLDDNALKKKTTYFKNLIANGKELDEILPEAFAVIREASFRVLGLRHYDVQLIGGCILHEGKIAEMKTGEGKTLVALLPAYLNGLKNSVHIVTVNEYLAKRDSVYIGRVLTFMGLNVGLISTKMDTEERKKNYACDVVYSTNSELGFDYLRDNTVWEFGDKVQKGFDFAIIDEVDSVLIDEARTPLVISQPQETEESKYITSKYLTDLLVKDKDYEIDKKNRSVTIKKAGARIIAGGLGIKDLYTEGILWVPYMLNGIRAREFYAKDRDYIIQGDKVVIVDESTGRTLDGRRWNDGLHQSIEAKEEIDIQDETKTLASVAYQTYFLFYKKCAGMTGTAHTERKELRKIYSLDVFCVPTNKKVIRVDEQDIVYKSAYSKWKAVLKECLDINEKGRPVLVGTSSVENSELIAGLLDTCGVKYNLLNAKPENAARESEIIAQAGRKGAITIATNMAGRGTDILLGGNPSFLAKSELKRIIDAGYKIDKDNTFHDSEVKRLVTLLENEGKEKDINEIENLIEDIDSLIEPKTDFETKFKDLYNVLESRHAAKCDLEKEEVVKSGGLHVIGTERHDSRRIDNQLRGRAGRQGDPGSSKFFLSLEDRLLQIFGGDKLKNLVDQFDIDDDLPIEGRLVNLSIERAQKRIEQLNYETRKTLFNYDNVINYQRRLVYGERDLWLQMKENKNNLAMEYLERSVEEAVSEIERCVTIDKKIKRLKSFIDGCLCLPYPFDLEGTVRLEGKEMQLYLNKQVSKAYGLKKVEVEEIIHDETVKKFEKEVLLQTIDEAWQLHLSEMDVLRENIGWRSYGQKDPLLEYQRESYELFSKVLSRIRVKFCYILMTATSFRFRGDK